MGTQQRLAKVGSFKSDNTVEFKAYFDALGRITMNFLLLSLRMGAGFMWMVHSINQVSVYLMTILLVVVHFFLVDFKHGTGLFLIQKKFVTLVSFYCSYACGVNSKIALE
jgi:hypothetical protein